jgi:hypothetical protein
VKRDNPNKTVRRLALITCALLWILGRVAIAEQEPETPVVDGHLGFCSANFTVMDNEQRPIYNAKINVVIRYGFLGIHRMTLQVGTDSAGKARVAGLPDNSKKPLKFDITSGRLSKTLMVDISAKCDSSVEVNLVTQ